jgi:hypothetical protein
VGKNKILVWKGNPSYNTVFKEFNLINDTTVWIRDLFGYYEGKIVVQLLNNKHLLDENIYILKDGKPWLISTVVPTVKATGIAPEMILIPGTEFSFEVTTSEVS